MKDNPILFLQMEELVAINQRMAGDGTPTEGQTKEGLLRACLSTPANKIGGKYIHQDIFEMAAAYLVQISHQKPFKSSNAPTAAMAAMFFLYLHNLVLTASAAEYAALVSSVAAGKATINQVSGFFRKNCAVDDEN